MNSAQPLVVRRMARYVERWQAASDQRVIFLRTYLMMTENMLNALARGEFQDRVWVNRLLRHFADYYFNALDAYDRRPAAAPPVWRLAHDTARDPKARALHHLLLGVNAHINYDLVLAVDDLLLPQWETLTPARRQARRADYDRVNDVIAQTIDAVQDQIIEPAMPRLDVLDRLMGPVDEWMVSGVVRHWRDAVWENAMRLIETRAQRQRATWIRQIETATLQRGHAILLKNGLTGLADLW